MDVWDHNYVTFNDLEKIKERMPLYQTMLNNVNSVEHLQSELQQVMWLKITCLIDGVFHYIFHSPTHHDHFVTDVHYKEVHDFGDWVFLQQVNKEEMLDKLVTNIMFYNLMNHQDPEMLQIKTKKINSVELKDYTQVQFKGENLISNHDQELWRIIKKNHLMKDWVLQFLIQLLTL